MTEEDRLRKAFGELIVSVRVFIAQLDAAMAHPSTHERGMKVAKLSNDLEISNDGALYHGLGFDFRQDDKGRKGNLAKILKWSRKRGAGRRKEVTDARRPQQPSS